ncbi:MAG: molybdopterin molybdotransferase MoeA [Desulfobacterales bacterium]|jgi:molybdopterin molybdotransferase
MKTFISFDEALALTLAGVCPGEAEILPLDQLTGKILADDIIAKVDSPSVTTSRKDGYAILSSALSKATRENPVRLVLVGHLSAGDNTDFQISGDQTVRVTTGAPLPKGADAVISEEFCEPSEDKILAYNSAEEGRNILERGTDIRQQEIIAAKGEKLSPALIGLLASAGLDRAPVYKAPNVAVIASGDEVVVPGKPLPDGKLYASNMIEICSWLTFYGLSYSAVLVGDRKREIQYAITSQLSEADAFITSGGAWGSERDLILDVVEELSWQGVYRRVRMGPGKPVGFGLLENKPFFILPGGPPSNEMAFLQLALPAIMKMKGETSFAFPRAQAQLSETVRGPKDWTQFIHAQLEKDKKQLVVKPAKLKSRLISMARKEALIIIPEGWEEWNAGEIIEIQLLNPEFPRLNFDINSSDERHRGHIR